MSTTIDDIAKACGLSRATVSRVLQNSPNVSARSRRLVEHVIQETGYQPNKMAQSLAQGFSNTVALIVGNISSIAQIEIAKVIQKGLYDHNYMVWLCNSDYSTELCDSYLDVALANKLAGTFLVTASATPKKLLQATNSDMPIVMIHRQDLASSCDSILGDDQKAAYQSVLYLLSMGHRHIVLLGVPQTMIAGRNAYWGYRCALMDNGLPFSESSVYEIDITSYSDALKSRNPFDVSRVFREHPDTTAVISLSHEVAIDFYLQCRKLGKRIPEDLSLISLDPVQASMIPEISFSTFGANQRALGQAAVKQMLERIQARKSSKQDAQPYISSNIIIEPTFFEGNSVQKL